MAGNESIGIPPRIVNHNRQHCGNYFRDTCTLYIVHLTAPAADAIGNQRKLSRVHTVHMGGESETEWTRRWQKNRPLTLLTPFFRQPVSNSLYRLTPAYYSPHISINSCPVYSIPSRSLSAALVDARRNLFADNNFAATHAIFSSACFRLAVLALCLCCYFYCLHLLCSPVDCLPCLPATRASAHITLVTDYGCWLVVCFLYVLYRET